MEIRERLQVILDSVDAVIYVADMASHEILYINKYARDIFGDVEGQICWQTFQAGQVGPCRFCTNERLVDGEGKPIGLCSWEFQNTVTGKWYAIHDRAILWEEGRPVRLEIAADITDRKQMEQDLELSKCRLEEAQRIARIGHWVSCPQTGYLWWSDVIYEIFGLDSASFSPTIEGFFNTVHPEDREAVKASLLDSEETGLYDIEHRIVHPDRTVRWVHERACLEWDDQGQMLRVGTVQDISERKAAELAGRRANRYLRALVKAGSALIYAEEETSLIDDVCRALADDNGYPLIWVGLAGKEAGACVEPAGSAGKCRDYLQEVPAGNGPAEKAFRHGTVQVTGNLQAGSESGPYREAARKWGLRSSIAVPLRYKDVVFGVLNVYAGEADAFDRDEQSLLMELANNLAYGLQSLRIRRDRDSTFNDLRLYATVFKHSAEGIFITDQNKRILAVNQAFSRITGYNESEALGKSPALLRSGEQDEDFYRNMWESLRTKGLWQGEIWNCRKNGEKYPEYLTISEVRDDGGELTNYVAVFADISQIHQTEQELIFLTYHDSLTGLPNRTLFCERLEHVLIGLERRQRHVGVVFLDLEGFGALNDTLGPKAGDEVLEKVGGRLQKALREGDTVARSGGDEFWILLEDLAQSEDTDLVIQHILTALHEPLTVAGQTFRLEASIGISLAPGDSREMNELLTKAATALHRAQKQGVGRVQFFRPEMGEQVSRFMQLAEALKVAIECDELRVWYQPQIELATGKVLAVEALVRWQHPEWGLISPVEFIPMAEETGLVVPLGEWVLEQALIQCAKWRGEGYPIERVGVNIAAAQLQGVGLEDLVARVLQQTGLPAECLELEITEESFLVNMEETRKTLDNLAELGVRLAIDDFGTGYSSLAYLKSLPVDTLKIDKTFIDGLPDDDNDSSIVKAILAVAQALGLDVLPEGIETVSQEAWLREQKVGIGQGFLYSPPQPAADLEKWWRDR